MLRPWILVCAALLALGVARTGAAHAERAAPPTTTTPATPPVSPFGTLVAVPAHPAAGPSEFRLLAHQEAAKAGLPYALVDAVMKIESDYRPDRIGDVGEIGLMQVRPGTAAMLGFKGTPEALADPATNIHYGTTYLGQAWHLTNGDVCRTLMKYRAGHGEEAMSALSASYCARARAHLVAVGSPLAALISPTIAPDLVSLPSTAIRVSGPVPGVGRARSGKAFWAAMEAKVSKISARIEARWRRVATR